MNASDRDDSAIPKLPLAPPSPGLRPGPGPGPGPGNARRRWTWSTIFGVVVVALFFTLAAGWIGFGVWARHRLDTQLAAIRDAGEPMTWRDLSGPVETTEAGREYLAAFQRMVEIDEFMNTEVLRYKIGPGSYDYEGEEGLLIPEESTDAVDAGAADDAAGGQDPTIYDEYSMEFLGQWAGPMYELVFEEAAEQKDAFPDSPLDSMLRRFGDDRDGKRRITAEEITRAADMVRAYASVYEVLERAAKMEPCELDFGEPPWHQAPELGLARRAANLLLLKGLVHIHRGELDEAVDAAITIIRIGRLCEKQRALIVHLFERAIASLGLAVMRETLSFGLPADAKLHELQAIMVELYHPDQLTRGVMADRIEGHLMIEDTRRNGGGSLAQKLPGPFLNYFEAQYLGDMAKVVAASRKPFPEIMDAMRVEPTGLLSGILLFKPEGAAVVEGRFLVNLRGVEIAIAVERHRRDHGSSPENLDQLVPKYLTEVPVDPFSDQPLKYKVNDDGYLIYSVDMNRIDDGGDMKIVGNEPPDYGITIRHRRK